MAMRNDVEHFFVLLDIMLLALDITHLFLGIDQVFLQLDQFLMSGFVGWLKITHIIDFLL